MTGRAGCLPQRCAATFSKNPRTTGRPFHMPSRVASEGWSWQAAGSCSWPRGPLRPY